MQQESPADSCVSLSSYNKLSNSKSCRVACEGHFEVCGSKTVCSLLFIASDNLFLSTLLSSHTHTYHKFSSLPAKAVLTLAVHCSEQLYYLSRGLQQVSLNLFYLVQGCVILSSCFSGWMEIYFVDYVQVIARLKRKEKSLPFSCVQRGCDGLRLIIKAVRCGIMAPTGV